MQIEPKGYHTSNTNQIMVLANVHDLEKLQARLRYGG